MERRRIPATHMRVRKAMREKKRKRRGNLNGKEERGGKHFGF